MATDRCNCSLLASAGITRAFHLGPVFTITLPVGVGLAGPLLVIERCRAVKYARTSYVRLIGIKSGNGSR